MPLYDFNSDYTIRQSNLAAAAPSEIHSMSSVPGIKQLSHVEGGRDPLDGSDFLAYPYDIEEFLIPGFRSLDDAMKQYWSGIRVPTKDSYRFMRVKIAGGDKSLLIWADDLKEGRARLPLATISRERHEFNVDKFSPSYHNLGYRYLNSRKDLVSQYKRPVPYNVDYTVTKCKV
mgnify:FL=1